MLQQETLMIRVTKALSFHCGIIVICIIIKMFGYYIFIIVKDKSFNTNANVNKHYSESKC